MKNNTQFNNENQLNAIPKSLIRLFSKAIAKLLLKFNVSKHDYDHFLNEQLVLEAKRQNPDISQVEIAVRTGINRRYIPAYLKGEMPKVKSSKLTLILFDIKWTLEKYYDGGKKLPKKGPFKTFESICEQWTSGSLTYSSILSELVRIGSLIDHGKKVELVEAKQSDIEDNKQYFEISSSLMNRYVNTVILNLQDIANENKNYQMSALSTQISPKELNFVKKEMRLLLKDNYNNLIDLLEKYESDVKPGTYPAYGVSVFEFIDEEEK